MYWVNSSTSQYCIGQSGVRIPVGEKDFLFSKPCQAGSGSHTASYRLLCLPSFFQGLKRPDRKVDHSSPSSGNERRYRSASSRRLDSVCGTSFHLLLLTAKQKIRYHSKNSGSCPSNQVSATAMTSASDEKWRPFNRFFSPGNTW